MDFQIKFHGHRIELGEIDFWINKFKGILKAKTIIREDHQGNKQIVSYIVLDKIQEQKSDTIFSEKSLYKYLKQKLPNFMIPAGFVILESFPLTPNNKLDKKAYRYLHGIHLKNIKRFCQKMKLREKYYRFGSKHWE